jgi:hypothetical protein
MFAGHCVFAGLFKLTPVRKEEPADRYRYRHLFSRQLPIAVAIPIPSNCLAICKTGAGDSRARWMFQMKVRTSASRAFRRPISMKTRTKPTVESAEGEERILPRVCHRSTFPISLHLERFYQAPYRIPRIIISNNPAVETYSSVFTGIVNIIQDDAAFMKTRKNQSIQAKLIPLMKPVLPGNDLYTRL